LLSTLEDSLETLAQPMDIDNRHYDIFGCRLVEGNRVGGAN
jgi:hypothetical protein